MKEKKKRQARADFVRLSREPTSPSEGKKKGVSVGVSVGGRSAERFLGRNWPLLFLWQNGRTPGRTDKRTYLLFLDFFVGFFSPSLKLTKMKKQNKN